MIEGLAKVMQSRGDSNFAKKVRAKTKPKSWIGLDVTQVPLTRGHLAVVTAKDKGDMLADGYEQRKHERVVGRRLVFSRGDAKEQALERTRDIVQTLKNVARRPIFNIPLPAGTFPTPEELNLVD